MAILQMMYPFSKQPESGQKVRVFLKNGNIRVARCTQVDMPGFHGLQWYDSKTGYAIDVNNIDGWLPSK